MDCGMSPTAVSPQSGGGQMDPAEPYDLVCIGFGPASLAIAVAIHDRGIKPRVLFLERQPRFAWHSGMLLPSARMQISFLKDLATFRNPRSHFTFLNYLKSKKRLEAFTNLGTFLPLREEFNDYLTWAAEHFESSVQYSAQVESIAPATSSNTVVKLWQVKSINAKSTQQTSYLAKHVVVAVGGLPKLPRTLQSFGPRIVHSSRYLQAVPQLLPSRVKETRVAVIGAGQSSAEIFEDLMERFPHVHATLFMSGAALQPSDDSPFVNEIFDAHRVDEFYSSSFAVRQSTLAANRATNYSVVRLELLDRLYERMYHQRLHSSDERTWQHRIVSSRELTGATQGPDGTMTLRFVDPQHGGEGFAESGFDLVITGTGYVRNAHEKMLGPVQGLLEEGPSGVDRDYRLKMKSGRIDEDCGIWLQGCCEESHGLSDSLLSILAVRGGEIVDSIFGKKCEKTNGTERISARL